MPGVWLGRCLEWSTWKSAYDFIYRLRKSSRSRILIILGNGVGMRLGGCRSGTETPGDLGVRLGRAIGFPVDPVGQCMMSYKGSKGKPQLHTTRCCVTTEAREAARRK